MDLLVDTQRVEGGDARLGVGRKGRKEEERFSTKESATHAIVAVHNTDINGQTVKCSWGKESGDPNNAQQTGQSKAQTYGASLSRINRKKRIPTGYWKKEIVTVFDCQFHPVRALRSVHDRLVRARWKSKNGRRKGGQGIGQDSGLFTSLAPKCVCRVSQQLAPVGRVSTSDLGMVAQAMPLLFSISLISVLFQALSSATYPYYAAAAAAAAAAAGVAGVGGVGGVGGAGQLGYWYPPQSYPTTATQMQAGGFLQGMQGYTYGQFAGYQQAQYMGMGMGVHAAGTAAGWGQGLPGGPQLPPHHATTVTAPPGVQAAPPPPPPPAQMMAYPMQQFQETASTTWLNLEFDQKNVAGERSSKMGIVVAYEIASEWKERKRQKREEQLLQQQQLPPPPPPLSPLPQLPTTTKFPSPSTPPRQQKQQKSCRFRLDEFIKQRAEYVKT
ncbi:Nucleolysin TIAR [Eufriesea mexicana]|uniref:Nucleolysin TIAR n=1 Tax=Eufriesea mexicana TaxID=516756 RepID=A0A310SXR4_9HYME|nr:Nucleolysin TIAR [Eufriesea mexicana]